MEIQEIKIKLNEIQSMGFIPSMRRSDTGIGYTLETLAGVKENNIRTPDFGKIELKSQRRGVSSKVTMLTFNKGAWNIKQREVVQKYGYFDENGRNSLYCFATKKPNNQGLYTDADNHALYLRHTDGTEIATWKMQDIVARFLQKMPALVVVIADTQFSEEGEEFWFNEAYYLHTPNQEQFVHLLQQDAIMLDLRLHLRESGSVRNHGTAFRTDEGNLIKCFAVKEALL